MKLKTFDLFSGVGGFTLGLEMTGGFETVAFCELDKHCHKVLNKHWPSIPIYPDIKQVKGKEILDRFGPIDVICGGFPCQSVSVSGNKRGLADENKSGLWFEYRRLIEEIDPRWIIIENVRNLLNIGLTRVLKDLHNLGRNVEWQVISARSVGAPHLRERVWLVAYSNGQRLQGQGKYREDGSSFKEEGRGSETITGIGPNTPITKEFPNADLPRFWPTFTSEKEKSEWWAEATLGISGWWSLESELCGVDDGVLSGLYQGNGRESDRKERIKQLGNSLVPFIPYIIGKRILDFEGI